jgi:translation initiation factor 2B subunit (eIF-2B alpha/beta/delta family)/8-oxo-dGTP pyrophosphatase MutT (NUDIX family)
MEGRAVVTCFLRHEGAVLLLKRSDEVGSYPGQWGGVAGHAEGAPDDAAVREIREETGLTEDDVALVRRGDPFDVTDEALGVEWRVHPYLFDATTREVTTNWETERVEWVAPTAIRHSETVPALWDSYDRVRPSVETVATDREHGAAYISVSALEVLRDEAALAAERGGDCAHLAAVARDLLDARPSMSVVRNRVNRVMHAVSDAETARPVEHVASAAIERAVSADRRAAEWAVDHISGQRVATRSRSGTVLQALSYADPEAVLVAESRPGREGVAVAEALADETDVTLTTDAGFAHALETWDADVLLVGADTVLADGRVVNKVGTRAAAIASSFEGIEVLVTAAADKLSPDGTIDLEARDTAEVYDGDADVAVVNRTFDVTPPDCVDGVITEQGLLDGSAVERVVEEHRTHATW